MPGAELAWPRVFASRSATYTNSPVPETVSGRPGSRGQRVPLNILLVQHDRVSAEAVRETLLNSSSGFFQVEWVSCCADGVARLAQEEGKERNRPDGIAAVLVDLFLPDSSGLETFEKLFRAAGQIPILVLCAAQDEHVARVAVQNGAHDYLLKDRLDPYLLPKVLENMVERAASAEELFQEKERAQVMLDSIGDAVLSTDVRGRITYLNISAEQMTGWKREEATGRPLEEILNIIDPETRAPAPNPVHAVMREDRVGHAASYALLRRDGTEVSVEDTAAAIHDRQGRVTGAILVFRDVTSARALALKMAHLAQHDALTDLPNRVLFSDRLSQAMNIAHRNRNKLAVLFLDLDRFKHTNDSLGHNIGDQLLQSVAQRLQSCLRVSDTVSRQGGDEFVILLSELARGEDAGRTAEKILQALNEPHTLENHVLHVGCSIGIATYPDDGTDAETLMKHADFAMYHAKDTGRNNYQFFKKGMNARAVERHALESALRRAIENQEFVLYYQPKLDLETDEVSGVEALIRWRHPKRGLILPAQFIPTAEESGLIVPIGRWALREACRQSRAWQDSGAPAMHMAVNVSAVELRDKDFVSNVRAILDATGVDPSNIELELTETFLMQDARSTTTLLRELKETGVQIALDDFGTGYSSLTHLKRFPIDILKIDQSFVREMTTDRDDASIVSAVINMGKNMRVRVVAEGVETREQLDFLKQESCPEGQGFYFSEAVDPVKLIELATVH